jgi:hypothetical protein
MIAQWIGAMDDSGNTGGGGGGSAPPTSSSGGGGCGAGSLAAFLSLLLISIGWRRFR